jgi:hypothetical protein
MEAQVPEKAVEIHKKLAGQKYPAAFDNLGWLMVKLHKDYGAAVTYFKTGSQLQDPDSMVSLVEMIDRGYWHRRGNRGAEQERDQDHEREAMSPEQILRYSEYASPHH